MQWTDRIRQVKIVLVIAAVCIAVISLIVSHFLNYSFFFEVVFLLFFYELILYIFLMNYIQHLYI